MSEHVGVINALMAVYEGELKQSALVFDKLSLVGVAGVRWLSDRLGSKVPPKLVGERALLEFLMEQGIAIEPEVKATLPGLAQLGLEREEDIYDLLVDDSEAAQRLRERYIGDWERNPDARPRIAREATERLCRRTAHYYRTEMGWEAVPIVVGDVGVSKMIDAGSDRVAELIIREMPVPDELTPWESIIDFRNDRDARGKYARLRAWLQSISQSGMTPGHLQDELRSLIYEYEEHMRLHRMKTRSGVVKTLFTAGAEFFEGVLRLKPTQAVNAVFSIRQQQIALLEAERSAPGRQIAYIVDAKRRFGR